MKSNQARRKQEDEVVKQENMQIALIRAILDAGAEAERLGRVQPNELSAEEISEIIRSGEHSARTRAIRDLQKVYWMRIGELKAEGLTPEQAREKLYQDVVDQSDANASEVFRLIQDTIHPLKPGGDSSPRPSQEPPTPQT